MKLQRAIGQTSQILNLFVQDGSVSTGAGLANVPATTVSYTWFHNNQAAVSTGTAVSTASMGTYTSGAWTQISSSLALGWYQFGLPDGALAIGDCVGVHIYVSTGAFPMVPLPIEIELVRDNPLQFTTSKVFLAHTSTSPANVVQAQGQNVVTSASGQFQVSTQALTYNVNVTSWANSTVVATSSGVVDVNLVNIWNKSAVTSASGQLTVSTQTVDKTGYLVNVTSFSNTITTNANVLQAYGSAIVTSASGQFRVSTQSLVGIVVSTQSLAGITVDIGTVYAQPLVTSGAGILNVSTQTLAAGAGDIISVYGTPIVTSAGGIIRVSTQAIDKGGYGVTTNADKTAYSLTAGERASIMDVINTTIVSENYRASSDAGTITQIMYEVLANVTDMGNSGTTRALNSVTSHTANGVQYQYDSTTPSSISRIA